MSVATNAQNTRRDEPSDETGGDCRNRDRSIFVQCRVIVLEHCHKAEIDCSAQTNDGDSLVCNFAKHRFATHSAETAVFLERIDDAIRKHPRNS